MAPKTRCKCENREDPFTLKGMESFFNEGESIKQEVGYAREIT